MCLVTPNVTRSIQNDPVLDNVFEILSFLQPYVGRHQLFQWEDIHKRQLLAKYQRDLILNKLTRAKFTVYDF